MAQCTSEMFEMNSLRLETPKLLCVFEQDTIYSA